MVLNGQTVGVLNLNCHITVNFLKEIISTLFIMQTFRINNIFKAKVHQNVIPNEITYPFETKQNV